MQPLADLAPAEQLERGPVGGRGVEEGEQLARALALARHRGVVATGGDEAAREQVERCASRPARFAPEASAGCVASRR
jgi:hypothetical protein